MDYYKIINQKINERLGGVHSAKILLYSLDFEEFKPSSDPNAWGPVADMFSGIAKRLERSGADCILICANTPHMVADIIQQRMTIPLINIAEVTAKAISSQNIHTVGLLGTGFTMELPFFKDRLSKFGIHCLIPVDNDRRYIHSSIYAELTKGIFAKETKEQYLIIINRLIEGGAKGIIFGCTEIPLLLKQEDCPVPIFDTTVIHATAAVEFALQN